ncbi:hypothetical protein RB600_005766 [Gaeumannomyces tritici]
MHFPRRRSNGPGLGAAPRRLLALALAVSSASGALASCIPRGEPKIGAVASETDVCSRVGTNLLRRGGNAVDAVVGTVACVGTIGMYHSGIGGGGFMLVRAANGTHEFVDFRETAPAAAFEDMYKDNPSGSQRGGLASGVPGELRGLEYAHKKYGKMSWRDVLAPAIKLARDGFTVNADLIKYMDSVVSAPGAGGFFEEDPNWAEDFAPTGRRVRLGETMTRKRLARTLETIAEHGAGAFYTGAIADATIAALRAANGTMTLADLANYTVAVRAPSEIEYRGYKVRSCSAPSGGVVALSTLNILNGYADFGAPQNVNRSAQHLNEAMRFAYAQRTKLGDPSFVPGLDAYQAGMLSAATAAEVRGKIKDERTFGTEYYDPDRLESLETPGTSHIATVDASGMAVSLTTTINLVFGSRLMVPETGVIMNDQMDDFSVPGRSNAFGYAPSPANFIRPGKRPLSSMSPVIVEVEGESGRRPYLVVGAAGGSRIITSTVQNVIHVLDGGKTVAQALAMPRLHDQLVPAVTTFEWAYDNSTVAYLKDLGHNVSWVAPGQSVAQGVRWLLNGTFEAAGEPRLKSSGGYAV